jgi:tetratricopeptide (TPR) repeat protein
VHGRRGQFSDAIAHYQRALDASRESSDFVTQGTTLVELSTVRLELGQIDGAIRAAMEAVELSRQTGNHYGRAQAMAVLGRAERDRGRPALARQHWLDAVAIFTELGLPQAHEVAVSLNTLDSASDGTGGAARVNGDGDGPA